MHILNLFLYLANKDAYKYNLLVAPGLIADSKWSSLHTTAITSNTKLQYKKEETAIAITRFSSRIML
jgi:hypothetical protein